MAKEEIFPIDENDTDVCVTLELDNGESLDCEILVIYESGNPFNDQEAILYRYAEEEDGSPIIDNIESEEEYEAAAAAFDAIQDEGITRD